MTLMCFGFVMLAAASVYVWMVRVLVVVCLICGSVIVLFVFNWIAFVVYSGQVTCDCAFQLVIWTISLLWQIWLSGVVLLFVTLAWLLWLPLLVLLVLLLD